MTDYYFSPGGNDSNPGTEPSPKQTLAEAASIINAAEPGDKVYFERDGVWTGEQLALDNAHGEPGNQIVVGNYGTGAKPVFAATSSGPQQTVKLDSCSYIRIRGLDVQQAPDFTFPGYNNIQQPFGTRYCFNFTAPQGAAPADFTHHCEIHDCVASFGQVGIHLSRRCANISVHDNDIHDNNMLEDRSGTGNWDPNPTLDLGCWAVLILGDYHNIHSNTLTNNNALDVSPNLYQGEPYRIHGNSFELYESVGAVIHHNTVVGDRVFAELGSHTVQGSEKYASCNIYAFNTHSTDLESGRFVTTRGPGHQFGPVNNTILRNNTSYCTGAKSKGLVSGSNTDPDITTLYRNIVWAEEETVYLDGPIAEQDNVFWATGGNPALNTPAGALNNSIVADPLFVNPANNNFNLLNNSPAIALGAGSKLP